MAKFQHDVPPCAKELGAEYNQDCGHFPEMAPGQFTASFTSGGKRGESREESTLITKIVKGEFLL
jgi:hypothetical protein